MPKLVKTNFGYTTFEKMPSAEELREHYAERYYQAADKEDSAKTYSTSYSHEEILHKAFVANLMVRKFLQLVPNSKIAFDLGCGEGFLVKSFVNHKIDCYAMDFSSFGMSQFNEDCLHLFEQGDVLDFKLTKISPKNVDIVSCINVLEHVLDPELLLRKLYQEFSSNTIFAIKVPNDYSKLHEYLLKRNNIEKEFWISYPEHLSYFNKESFVRLANACGFEIISILADYPIDLFLLCDELNYIQKPNAGKTAHNYRIETELFLSTFNYEDVISLYEAYGNMGIGRNLTYFLKKCNCIR